MALRINDTAPNFTAHTTHGPTDFHNWIADSWAILFSHPKDFTPVCTTELGYMAKIEPEFTRRNAKLIGLSVDPVDSHSRWLGDIEETQGAKVNYPIIADSDLAVSKLYNMLPADEPGTSEGRTGLTQKLSVVVSQNTSAGTKRSAGPSEGGAARLAMPQATAPFLDSTIGSLTVQ